MNYTLPLKSTLQSLGSERVSVHHLLRSFSLFVMLFLALPLLAQEQLRKSHVVDKETGETLPYTYVSVSNENRTITNYEGDFSITANDDDRIAVSCVGFETAHFQASQLPKVIRLVPLAKTMQTVQVVG